MKAEKAYLDKLIWALEHRDRETVLRAITILGMLGSEAEAAVPALQEVFKKGTRDPYIQANAAMVLMKINAKKARGFLSS